MLVLKNPLKQCIKSLLWMLLMPGITNTKKASLFRALFKQKTTFLIIQLCYIDQLIIYYSLVFMKGQLLRASRRKQTLSYSEGKNTYTFKDRLQHSIIRSRFKTEQNEEGSGVFPFYKHSSEKQDLQCRGLNKYENIRYLELKNRKQKKKLFAIFEKNKKRPSQKCLQKVFDRLQGHKYKYKASEDQLKHVKTNYLNFCAISACFITKTAKRDLISHIKAYVLEQESDLITLQSIVTDNVSLTLVRQIVFYERMLIILMVQNVISKKDNVRCLMKIKSYTHELHFNKIIQEILLFYFHLFSIISNIDAKQLLKQNNYSTLGNLLDQALLSQFSLLSIKNKISKLLSDLLQQYRIIHKFMIKKSHTIRQASINTLYYDLLQFYAVRLTKGNWLDVDIQFLLTCPAPYVLHDSTRKYTLLLDLDETLVHYKVYSPTKAHFLVRPFLKTFLQKMQPYYQLGIFTNAIEQYANIVILEYLPTIKIRLFRQHTVVSDGEVIKDLSRVGRDLNRLILVDNLQKNYKLQKQNGINVRSWYGSQKDNILHLLGQQLLKLVKESPENIRQSGHKRYFL